jgi:hypothetical protein
MRDKVQISPVATGIGRLALAAFMGGMLLLGLAYWWLDNLVHEIVGLAMFVALAWHVASHRDWFARLFKGRYTVRRAISAATHLSLLLSALALFATSIAISKSVFSFLNFSGNVYLGDIHWFSAYWLMLIAGAHLGVNWWRVMAFARASLGLPPAGIGKRWLLRAVVVCVAASGVWSFFVLHVGTKLTFNYSLEFWDFSVSVAPFFGHWASVVALPAVVTHYGLPTRFPHGRAAARTDASPSAPGCQTGTTP